MDKDKVDPFFSGTVCSTLNNHKLMNRRRQHCQDQLPFSY